MTIEIIILSIFVSALIVENHYSMPRYTIQSVSDLKEDK